jgi:hypothetical protein
LVAMVKLLWSAVSLPRSRASVFYLRFFEFSAPGDR